MNRPTRQQLYMEIANVVAKRSTCFRLNVGAIIVKDNRIISMGYNGQKPGQPHCAGNFCAGIAPGNCPTIHAEANAFHYAPDCVGADLYVTHAPCSVCAAEAIDRGVRRVFFGTPYRDDTPIKVLRMAGLEVYQVTPAGYVISKPSDLVVDELP